MGTGTSSTMGGQTTYRGLDRDYLDFLSDLKKYTVPDIKKLQQVALEHEHQNLVNGGRCSTALASLCFAVVESVGLVLRKNLGSPRSYCDAIKGGNIANAIPFFDYAQQQGITSITHSKLKAIYVLYRNKIIHSLFPKYGLGIAQNGASGVTGAIIDIGGVKSLNVNWLAYTVLKVLEHLELETNNITAPVIVTINNNINAIKSAEIITINAEFSTVKALYPDLQDELSSIVPGLPLTP